MVTLNTTFSVVAGSPCTLYEHIMGQKLMNEIMEVVHCRWMNNWYEVLLFTSPFTQSIQVSKELEC